MPRTPAGGVLLTRSSPFQGRTCTQFGTSALRDHHGLARLRVATLACWSNHVFQGQQPGQVDAGSVRGRFHEDRGQPFDHSVDRGGWLLGSFDDGGDQGGAVHESS